ncbi:MAG TPA: sodium-dependent transporter [Candidatus Marinimicrobia bacterium]|nr:sodium-dependent transporter [Candidatus Neomarinimicrobiota bacterium]
MINQREQWGSKRGFVLAAAGSAVGLGNIWKFPYLVGENGGAAFILLYLVCVILVGLPVVIAEILIGRTTQRNPVGSFRELSQGNPFWMAVGGLGVLTGFLILSYYNVIAGWCLGYVVESFKGSFQQIENPALAGELFSSLSSKPHWTLLFHGLFMMITITVIYAGITKGIERASKIMMPALLVLILILVIRGVTLKGSAAGVGYLLKVDFSVITGKTFFLALGQAFFSLSLGMGALLTYGSYMSKKESIPGSALQIVILDTVIALLAGFMIFPAVFAMGMHPAQGPSLIFNILPVVFNSIPAGYFFRIVFFLLLTVAALTSTISLLEVITTFVVDEFRLPRKMAAIFLGIVVFVIGLPSALSFCGWQNVRLFGLTCFDFVDFISANIFLPLGGIFIALFVGWFWGAEKASSHLLEGAVNLTPFLVSAWSILIRFIAPVLILLIFLSSIGIL